MLKSYLIIALRQLRKTPAYSLINLVGLALGLACAILILLYVQDEFSYDRFHQNRERIYRIVETRVAADRSERSFAATMGPVGPALVEAFPEIKHSVRMRSRTGLGRLALRVDEQRFYVADHLVTEPSFFEIFDFKLLQGEAQHALREPFSVVLTQAAAEKYFGQENPLGKILATDRFNDLKVTGVVQNPPRQSHLDFSMLISFATLEANRGWQQFIASWESDDFITYVLAERELEIASFEARLPTFLQKQRANAETALRLTLQPLTAIHFGSTHLETDLNRGKSEMLFVYVLCALALFILVIACINYTNLATARALKRGKEVGMRKVVGANRKQLGAQFLGEAIMLSGLALLLSLVLVELLLPPFNNLADKQLTLDFAHNGALLLGLLILLLSTSVLAGGYPAFYLARLRPTAMFKSAGKTGTRLRQVLVVAQFALSIIMIAATATAYRQMAFVREKNLGFKQDQLVVIDINSGNARRNFQTIKNEIAKLPAIKNVSVSSRVPGEWKNLNQVLVMPEGTTSPEALTMFFMCIDQAFLSTFEMQLRTGRNLSETMGADTAAVLINEAAARALGWREPLGKELRTQDGTYRARVVGVVQDFHFQSLHESIAPLVLGHWNNPVANIDYFTARVQGGALPQTLAALQRIHEQFDQATPFEYNVLDERLEDFYRADIRLGKIFGLSAGLTVAIACLGLLGLAAFAAEQRTKEIGIRKVLGASIFSVVRLLTNEFLLLIALANLLAWPLAYFALQQWLQNFAYRISLTLWPFVLSGVFALGLALLTVSFQALKAALTNPVEALRYE